jgi:hypothetical protein
MGNSRITGSPNSFPHNPELLYADHQDASPALPPLDPHGITTGPLRRAILRPALPAVAAMTTLWHWGRWQTARA